MSPSEVAESAIDKETADYVSILTACKPKLIGTPRTRVISIAEQR